MQASYSIEQVNRFATPVRPIDGYRSRCEGAAFELVGWRFWDELGQAAEMNFGQKAYCERHKSNENLWEMLRALESKGRVTIRCAEADIMGVKVDKSTSLIVWGKLE